MIKTEISLHLLKEDVEVVVNFLSPEKKTNKQTNKQKKQLRSLNYFVKL